MHHQSSSATAVKMFYDYILPICILETFLSPWIPPETAATFASDLELSMKCFLLRLPAGLPLVMGLSPPSMRLCDTKEMDRNIVIRIMASDNLRWPSMKCSSSWRPTSCRPTWPRYLSWLQRWWVQQPHLSRRRNCNFHLRRVSPLIQY